MKRSSQGDLEVLGKLNHKSQVINKSLSLGSLEDQSRSKLLIAKLNLLNWKRQHLQKLAVEEIKLEEELTKVKARVKVTEAHEELNKGKTLDSGLNSGNQIVFTEK